MSISKTPKGYRVQVYDKRTGKTVALSTILPGEPALFGSKAAAKRARERARERIAESVGKDGPTLRVFVDRWTTDRLFERPKESTNLQNHWAIQDFVSDYGHLPIRTIGHQEVAEYLAGGSRMTRVPALRAMWNDARSGRAGRLVDANPWERLGLPRSTGNRHNEPPGEAMVWKLITSAREQGGPAFAAWLQYSAFTGCRPGEVDGLRWEYVDFERGRVRVREQFNSRSRNTTTPKHESIREAILTPPAREALLGIERKSEFCFVAPRGGHYTPASRRAPWDRVREATGYTKTLYLATRHFAGWYMVNVLGLDSEDVAIALGHRDGGQLVRVLYGHRDREAALDRVARAFEGRSNVRPLRVAK